MAHGGKRPGAGGKEGSIRPKLTHYWSQEDIQDYFNWLRDNYKNDASLVKFVGEQLMGKATQAIVTEDEAGNRKPILAELYTKE